MRPRIGLVEGENSWKRESNNRSRKKGDRILCKAEGTRFFNVTGIIGKYDGWVCKEKSIQRVKTFLREREGRTRRTEDA